MPSYSKHRLSSFSNHSNTSNTAHSLSRPVSTAFPFFHSSLSYALVRDFGYPSYHPLHYGPPPEQSSGISTPASEAHRRLSDPAPAWERTDGWDSWRQSGEQLPSTVFGDHDGPPWSEDEDLASPVVTSSKHRKNKSNMYAFDQTARGRSRDRSPKRIVGSNGDGSEPFHTGDEDDTANARGSDFITYPPGMSHAPGLGIPPSNRRDSHFARPVGAAPLALVGLSSSPALAGGSEDGDGSVEDTDESRYSRNYQFTIASPDEEMHGRAVALFDFARENDNELPLVEGQVILVSYRHGQGWLVAQDSKTGESGLVPEEYVRLLRDIEGGWNGLENGGTGTGTGSGPAVNTSPEIPEPDQDSARTPTQSEHNKTHGLPSKAPTSATVPKESTEYYPSVVSTFSTSRGDLERWPHHKLGSHPQTPTAGEFPRGGGQDARGAKNSNEFKRDENDSTPTRRSKSKSGARTDADAADEHSTER